MVRQQPPDHQANNDNQNQRNPYQSPPVMSRRLAVCAMVLVLAVFLLSSSMLLLQYELNSQKKARAQAIAQAALSRLSSKSEKDRNGKEKELPKKTVKPFHPHTLDDLHIVATAPKYPDIGELYWQQAQSVLAEWDPNLGSSSSSATSASAALPWEVEASEALRGLHRAAELGHAQGQFYTSMAYWSGIWPISVSTTSSSSNNHSSTSTVPPLQVHSDWWAAHPSHNEQHTKAVLWLHMAAMAGHEEAAIAMTNKVEYSLVQSLDHQSATTSSASHASEATTCPLRLPYAEAAADIIVDRLQASPQHGRGKILPPTDKHVLHQLHMLGASKFLEAHNQPDESLPALQFYQVRASATDDPHAASAAYTLGHFYHTGARGVPVNLTEALHWYQVAATMDHAEAAGHAGDMWLYGMGTPDHKPNPYEAYRWYQKGVPFSIDSCRRKWEYRVSKKDNNALICDSTCLNGMGVLLLLGLPMMVSVEMGTAEKFFELAKDQGKHDAAYNLAMMKLGWKTHWRTREEAAGMGEEENDTDSEASDAPSSTTKDGKKGGMFAGMPRYSLTRSEWSVIMTDLSTAASAGHVQARHRLAKLYTTGVQIEVARSPGQSSTEQQEVIPRDCDKAYKNFKWIMDNASLHRNQRLRKAYKQYMAGDSEGSLRNYLIAAETGNDLAQMNAAFLLEQGTCLGLADKECAKAAVRLYKAAASRGHGEASLRVGDFYYYGRFRSGLPSGPFAWLQYVLYPEKYVGKLWNLLYSTFIDAATKDALSPSSESTRPRLDDCPPGDESCRLRSNQLEEDHTFEHDMEMAADYYRYAAEKAMSLRANFNLGFLYEWGLGLKQDFPLAKRHYDLALPTSGQVSPLPVTLALNFLVLHEKVVRLYHTFRDLWKEASTRSVSDTPHPVPKASKNKEFGRPVPSSLPEIPGLIRDRELEVILKHLFSLESLVILLLTVILWKVIRRRTERHH